MTERTKTQLTVPEVMPENPNYYEAFRFIQQLFADNGCLGRDKVHILSGDYFRYAIGDRGAKQLQTSHYLVNRNRPVIVFNANLTRKSQIEFEELQDERSRDSNGYNTIATAGDETYHISILAPARGLQKPQIILGTSHKHQFGTRTSSSGFDSYSGLYGSLLQGAAEEHGYEMNQTPSAKSQINASAIGKLLVLIDV